MRGTDYVRLREALSGNVAQKLHMLTRLMQIALLMTLVQCGSLAVYACMCIPDPLKERFRKAEAVFIGKYVDERPDNVAEIQNDKPDLLIFEVIKGWKGTHNKYIGIDLGPFPEDSGACPLRYRFDKDTDYLVFAYGDSFAINVECSDTKPLTPIYNETAKDISRLNSSWFRFKTRVWPF